MNTELVSAYFELGNQLENSYPELNFKNHCYWRIALDHVCGDRWDNIIERPAYKNLSESQLKHVIALLKDYGNNKAILIAHNRQSLIYRKK